LISQKITLHLTLLESPNRNLTNYIVGILFRKAISCLFDMRDSTYILLSHNTVQEMKKLDIPENGSWEVFKYCWGQKSLSITVPSARLSWTI
jgi:hypothetical protein